MEEKNICQRCGKKYTLVRNGYNIIKTIDDSNTQMNLCISCQDELFEWMQKYKDSLREKSYKCARCGKTYSKDYRIRGLALVNQHFELAGNHFDLCPNCIQEFERWIAELLFNKTHKGFKEDLENDFIIDFNKEGDKF